MNYGSSSLGCHQAAADQGCGFYPAFYLDMLSVVGRTGHAISPPESPYVDGYVSFSLKDWWQPYTSKHAISSLPFDLTNRTFRIGRANTRELWFLVMHPRSLRRGRQGGGPSGQPTAMQRHHAQELATYITNLFLHEPLLGLGVEPSWKLGNENAIDVPFRQWATFQEQFMAGWDQEVVARLAFDDFWRDHVPSFHAYDHGANIEMQMDDEIRSLPPPPLLRNHGGDTSSENGSSDDEDDDDNDDAAGARNRRRSFPRGGGIPGVEAGGAAPVERAVFLGDIEKLRASLDGRYDLSQVEQISYALAANINATQEKERGEAYVEEPAAFLADRNQWAHQYASPQKYTFFPMAFHPRFGNVSSPEPPRFLEALFTVLRDNAMFQNEGADVVSFGFFQAYSNIKRTIRSRPEDLLAAKGTATGALTLPPAEADQDLYTQRRQQRLLDRLRGGQTPDQPAASTPFARERGRVQAAMAAGSAAFRFEQVITLHVARMVRARRTLAHILQPIFELARFFLHESSTYGELLWVLPIEVFPGVLRGYATLFEMALHEMITRFDRAGPAGLTLGDAEAVALLDRLGNYCFTGDGRVLPTAVLRPLRTLDSLRLGGWPFVSPDMLAFGGSGEETWLNVSAWARGGDRQLVLLHVAALAFHYSPTVASHRRSQVWFTQCQPDGPLSSARAAALLAQHLFDKIWIPETMQFLQFRWRRQRQRRSRSRGSREDAAESARQWHLFESAMEAWRGADRPFHTRCVLFPPPPPPVSLPRAPS
jgi:hypothetical protein